MAARLAWLALALALALPTLDAGGCLAIAAGFLVEFASQGRWSALSLVAAEPAVHPLRGLPADPPIAADLYVTPWLRRPAGLVLVHGLSPSGKDEPRLREAARLLARAGWAVAVPTLDGLTRLRLRPEDTLPVAASIRALTSAGHVPVSLLGVSVGGGPTLLAATDPAATGLIAAVLVLGGYASSEELLRHALTGAYHFGPHQGRHQTDEAAIGLFARANADLLDAAGRRLVQNRDPAAVNGLLADLPPVTRRLLDDLSPGPRLGRLAAPLFLVHGRDDPAVPYTESLRLLEAARAAGRPARLALVGAVGHVEPEGQATVGEVLRLGATFYAFSLSARRVTSAGPGP